MNYVTKAETFTDNPLWKNKRERQARSRELVRSSQRTLESMGIVPASIIKTFKIKHRA